MGKPRHRLSNSPKISQPVSGIVEIHSQMGLNPTQNQCLTTSDALQHETSCLSAFANCPTILPFSLVCSSLTPFTFPLTSNISFLPWVLAQTVSAAWRLPAVLHSRLTITDTSVYGSTFFHTVSPCCYIY